jgi:hypothetical protein
MAFEVQVVLQDVLQFDVRQSAHVMFSLSFSLTFTNIDSWKVYLFKEASRMLRNQNYPRYLANLNLHPNVELPAELEEREKRKEGVHSQKI